MTTLQIAQQLAEDAIALAQAEDDGDYSTAARELSRRGYELVDAVAAERGIVQSGTAWERLRHNRDRRLGLAPRTGPMYYRPHETVDLVADPEERRLAVAYGMCSGDPETIVDAIQFLLIPDDAPLRAVLRIREFRARLSRAWYGED